LSIDKGYDRTVSKILKAVPMLSKPESAARLLGLPIGEFEGLMQSGDIPTVPLGTKAYIPKSWLSGKLMAALEVKR